MFMLLPQLLEGQTSTLNWLNIFVYYFDTIELAIFEAQC